MVYFQPCIAGSVLSDLTLPQDTIIQQKGDTTIVLYPLSPKQNDTTLLKKKDPIVEFFNNRSSDTKFNRWIKDLVVNSKDTTPKPFVHNINYETDFRRLEGKHIHSIRIKQIDPFGTSIHDTTMISQSWLGRTGNNLRIPTSTRIIRKNLTFSAGESIDPRNLSESERILRQLNFINDAKIEVQLNAQDTTLVDLVVITRDKYPHAFNVGLSSTTPEVTLYTRNLAGQGLGLSHTQIITSPQSDDFGFTDQITISNVGKSRINLKLDYSQLNSEHFLIANAQRSFYFTDLKYAGGFYYNRSYKNSGFPGGEQIDWQQDLSYRYSDVWLGRSFKVETSNYFNQSHFYLTGQLQTSKFHNLTDSLSNHPLLIFNRYIYTGLTFSKRNYYKNNLIYSYGRTEDVPYGFMASVTMGVNGNDQYNRPYVGGHFSFGKAIIPNKGYFYFRSEAGSFFNKGQSEQGFLNLTGKYISNLEPFAGGYLRHFVELDYLKGFNRLDKEFIYLSERRQGLTGFSNKELRGKEKMVLSAESIYFSPHNIIGFRIIGLAFADLGVIGDGKSGLLKQDYQLSIGAGIRLHNDNLVFRTIQIRLAYIPFAPSGASTFDLDISGETTKRFDDFVPGAPKRNEFK